MTTKMLSQMKLKKWKFGKYYDDIRQKAFLVIYFISRGEKAKLPLVLPFSEYAEPKTVMKKLLDNSADIDAKIDKETLEERLNSLDFDNGIYVQKVGNVRNVFLRPPKVYGPSTDPIVVDQKVADASQQAMGQAGSFKKWKENVAVPAEQSSFCMFAISLALSAVVYREIIGDEGVIFNIAGRSGLGKTTCAIVGKSVSGQTERLFDWKTSLTALSEALAAHSDMLFVIDDFEKIPKRSNVSETLATSTHFITTGRSKAYANMVKDKLPDLFWCCPVLTSGPTTVEQQAIKDHYARTDGDRRRMIDILIPDDNGKGIWDHLSSDEDTGAWSDAIRLSAKENYGCLIEPWIEAMFDDRKSFVGTIKGYLNDYLKDNRFVGDTGFEDTISKKFGIVYASGQKAIDDGLLPWDSDHFYQSIVALHQTARNVIRAPEQILKSALISMNEKTSDEDVYPYVTKSQEARFKNAADVTGFIRETRGQRHLFITESTLIAVCGGQDNMKRVIEALDDVGAYIAGSGGKASHQQSVYVNGKLARKRFIKIELNAFDVKLRAYSS